MKDSKKKVSQTQPSQIAVMSSGVKSEDIVNIVEKSFINYSLSVIIDRALPDVRDGLKPVHRRIIYAMKKLGISSSSGYKKCAKVVGETMGNYHPHGDVAIYDSLVRMAQEWSLRYPLIWGQGNFGSIDGDGPAAYRYTECKLMPLTELMIRDIEKDTVDFRDNFDGTEREPTVMPAAFPNLLVNGVTGIAVGMATNMPPHNLGEINALAIAMLKNPDVTLDELVALLPGPDFPTGGHIYNREDIVNAYKTGRGPITMRANAVIEEGDKKAKIIVTEVPYQTSPANIIMKIADLVKEKKIQGITDVNDESSSRIGMRLVVDLSRDAHPQKILNQLYKYTDLQVNFSVNMVALKDGGIKPHLFNLRELIEEFVNHRVDVITRRCVFELNKAQEREHILEGLMIALDHIDEIIKLIRASKDTEDASTQLQSRFKLSERQAQAILEMKLKVLSGLERKKVEDELNAVRLRIAELQSILNSHEKLRGLIITELNEITEKFGDKRRTIIHSNAIGKMADEDLIADEQALVMLTKSGYIKRMLPDTFRAQGRGGKGVKGGDIKEDDFVLSILDVRTHDEILFFTSKGRVFRTKAFEIPEALRTARGTSVVNLINLESGEEVTAMINTSKKKELK